MRNSTKRNWPRVTDASVRGRALRRATRRLEIRRESYEGIHTDKRGAFHRPGSMKHS